MKKEEYNNLSQLDRIEYTLEKKDINEKWNGSLFPILNYLLFFYIVVFLLISIFSLNLLQINGQESFTNMVSILPLLTKGFSIVVCALIIVRLISGIVFIKKLKKLYKKFIR